MFYPPLKYIWGCVWLFLQAQEGNTYFTELAERVEYGNYVICSWHFCKDRPDPPAPSSPPCYHYYCYYYYVYHYHYYYYYYY